MLVGGAGNDRLIGDGGSDAIFGSAGEDFLVAKDGVRDVRLRGGRGSDKVSRDRIDAKPVS